MIMTHFGPMHDSAGTFTPEGSAHRHCQCCKAVTLHTCDAWHSDCGGYEDYRYQCTTCKAVHWVDGPDS